MGFREIDRRKERKDNRIKRGKERKKEKKRREKMRMRRGEKDNVGSCRNLRKSDSLSKT